VPPHSSILRFDARGRDNSDCFGYIATGVFFGARMTEPTTPMMGNTGESARSFARHNPVFPGSATSMKCF